MHGRREVIVYTSMCTSIVLLTWKNFHINIEITIKPIKSQVCMAETVLSRAINTGFEIQTNDCFNCLEL